jgi:hypothetical protein
VAAKIATHAIRQKNSDFSDGQFREKDVRTSLVAEKWPHSLNAKY